MHRKGAHAKALIRAVSSHIFRPKVDECHFFFHNFFMDLLFLMKLSCLFRMTGLASDALSHKEPIAGYGIMA
jgi:hypothetical protein